MPDRVRSPRCPETPPPMSTGGTTTFADDSLAIWFDLGPERLAVLADQTRRRQPGVCLQLENAERGGCHLTSMARRVDRAAALSCRRLEPVRNDPLHDGIWPWYRCPRAFAFGR